MKINNDKYQYIIDKIYKIIKKYSPLFFRVKTGSYIIIDNKNMESERMLYRSKGQKIFEYNIPDNLI